MGPNDYGLQSQNHSFSLMYQTASNFLVPHFGLGHNFVPKLFYSSSYVEGGQKIVLILVEENFVT